MSSHASKTTSVGAYVWDFLCAASLIGIWPRYIEPNLLEVTRHNVPTARALPPSLQGLRIVHFSDLHLDDNVPQKFLDLITERVRELNPDLIAFTGDFLCYSRMQNPARLKAFLNTFSAPYGCYAVLGNHDYEQYVGINADGEYDLVSSKDSAMGRMLKRLFVKPTLAARHALRLTRVPLHKDLLAMLEETPFTLLQNETQQIAIGESYLNICGLGEYTAKDFIPQQAFRDYDRRFPGVLLAHNPDVIPRLVAFPGDLLLCGHTHGGQINFPWLVDRCTLMEHPEFRRGYFAYGKRMVNVNRGLGGVVRLRWRARPELTLLTLGTAS